MTIGGDSGSIPTADRTIVGPARISIIKTVVNSYEVHKLPIGGNAGGSGLPTGTVIAYASYNAPQGFLLCDGSNIDASLYPDLVALIGAKTPDLREQFIRGANGQSAITGFTKHTDKTRMPRSPFNISPGGGHNHDIRVGYSRRLEKCSYSV